MRKKLVLLFVFVVLSTTKAQNITNQFEMPVQSFLKYNTTIINPALSIYNPKDMEILAFYRNQNSDLNDAPKTYLLNFNASNWNKNGYGLSIYQKTVGVFKSFGAIANYAKGINLSDENSLAIGFNVIAFNTDINTNLVKLGQADPIFQNFEKTNSIIINPGVALRLNNLNFGITVPNLFDYNFRTSKQTTDFNNKTYSGHVHYETQKSEADNLFENAHLAITTIAKYQKNNDLEYTGGLVYNAPRMGWLQGSYNNNYGVSAGVGININTNIALGYAYERNLKNNLTAIGPTHDVFLTFNFGDSDQDEKVQSKPKSDNSTKTMEQEEIQRYKKKVYTKDIVEQELKTKQKLEDFIKNAEEENISYFIESVSFCPSYL